MRKIWTPRLELPKILTADKEIKALQAGLEDVFAEQSSKARLTMHLPRLDELTGTMLDMLLNQYHADFFEAGMSDERKRQIIRDVIRWHRIKGTPAAVEEAARMMYRDAHVTEWYEYGGQPYWFRILQDVTADDEDTDRYTLDLLRAAVGVSKNTRSWLDYFCFIMTFDDANDPDDDLTVHVDHEYIDVFDFGARMYAYDGQTDYGVRIGRGHNGSYNRSGRYNRRGFEAHGDHGRLQGSHFERFFFDMTFEHEEKVPMPDGIGSMVLRQEITHNGRRKRNGTIKHNGSLIHVEQFLNDNEEQQLQELVTWLKANYQEICPSCGAREYSFEAGSARIGSEVRLVDDPQLLTVDVFCRQCRTLMHQYLVQEGSWELIQ